MAGEQTHEPDKSVAAQRMFREEVRRIPLSGDLAQVNPLLPHGLLHPESMGVQMAQLAEALPGTYTDSCRAIRPDTHGDFEAQISKQALVPEGHTRRFNHTIKLRFPTAEANGSLS